MLNRYWSLAAKRDHLYFLASRGGQVPHKCRYLHALLIVYWVADVGQLQIAGRHRSVAQKKHNADLRSAIILSFTYALSHCVWSFGLMRSGRDVNCQLDQSCISIAGGSGGLVVCLGSLSADAESDIQRRNRRTWYWM